MRTKEEVLEFLKNRSIGKGTMKAIRQFLLGAGLCTDGNDFRRQFVGDRLFFDEFLQWFNDGKQGTISATVEMGVEVKDCSKCKIENKWETMQPLIDVYENASHKLSELKSKPEPKYKVGQYVRTTKKDLLKITRIENGIYYYLNKDNMSGCMVNVIFESCSEVATPKEGEFWYVRTAKNREYIYCKNGNQFITSKLYSLRLDINYVSDIGECVCSDCQIVEHRPASDHENQRLIKAVEENYKKTWDGKEWVEMKSVKEQFEEWKNQPEQNTQWSKKDGISKLNLKMSAIRELCLFAKFVNDGENPLYAIITVADKIVIKECNSYHEHIDKLFATEQCAQQAIEVLGEDLIKTALSN